MIGRPMRAMAVAALVMGLGGAASAAERSGPSPADLARGVQQVQSGQFAAGLATLEAYVRDLDPHAVKSLVTAYSYMGVAFLGQGDPNGAVAVFGAALDLDRGLRLRTPSFPPEAVKVFDDLRARRELSSQPARREAQGRTAAKLAIITGGVAAVGGAAAVLTRGPGAPELALDAASFEIAALTCPDGAAPVVLPFVIEVPLHAGPQLISVYEGVVRMESVPTAGTGTNISTLPTTVLSPLQVEAGKDAVVLLRSSLACRNPVGDAYHVMQWKAFVTLRTSGGVVQSVTRNLLEVVNP